MRITKQMLLNKIQYLNEITNSPLKPYIEVDGKYKAQIGCFTLYQAYGLNGLHRIVNEGGGVTDRYVYGLHSKRDLYERVCSFIDGINFKKVE